MPDILLTHGYFLYEDEKERQIMKPYPPLGLLYLSAYLKRAGFSVVREYVGHGIGTAMHEEPQIPNYGPPGRGLKLKEGMVLAIEPMVNAGGPETELLADGWTVVTRDRRRSAHFEHTVAVTANGPEVLTLPW